MRWRAMDQLLTTKYIPEGFNFWDEAYDDYVAMKNDKGEPKYKIVSDGSSTANMSAKEDVYKRQEPYFQLLPQSGIDRKHVGRRCQRPRIHCPPRQ